MKQIRQFDPPLPAQPANEPLLAPAAVEASGWRAYKERIAEHERFHAYVNAIAREARPWPSSATFAEGAAVRFNRIDVDLVQRVSSCYPEIDPMHVVQALSSGRGFRFSWGAIFETVLPQGFTWNVFFPPHESAGAAIPAKLAKAKPEAIRFLQCLALQEEVKRTPWPVAFTPGAGFPLLAIEPLPGATVREARLFMRDRFAPWVMPMLAMHLARLQGYGMPMPVAGRARRHAP